MRADHPFHVVDEGWRLYVAAGGGHFLQYFSQRIYVYYDNEISAVAAAGSVSLRDDACSLYRSGSEYSVGSADLLSRPEII